MSCYNPFLFPWSRINIHEVSHLQFSFNINYWDNWKTVSKSGTFSILFSLKINGKLIFYPIISRGFAEIQSKKPPSSSFHASRTTFPRVFFFFFFWRGPTSCPRITVNPSYPRMLSAKINRGRFRFCRLWGDDASKDVSRVWKGREVARSRISLRKWNVGKGGREGRGKSYEWNDLTGIEEIES